MREHKCKKCKEPVEDTRPNSKLCRNCDTSRQVKTTFPQNKQIFDSGATSSENKPAYDQVFFGFIRRVASRFQLGEIKHKRGNYLTGIQEFDVKFLRDRYSHAVEHLLAIKETGDVPYHPELDNLAAVGWFLSIAMEAEEIYGIDWREILKMRVPHEEGILLTAGNPNASDNKQRTPRK